MVRFSVRLDYLFAHYHVLDAVRLAKEAGADAIEIGALDGVNVSALKDASQYYGIPIIACGQYDMSNVRFGMPFSKIEKTLNKTIECAKLLGTNMIIFPIDSEIRPDESYSYQFFQNVQPTIELLKKMEICALVAPPSANVVGELFGSRPSLWCMCNLLEELNTPFVKLLFDCYKIQAREGNILNKIHKYHSLIGHYYISGVPNRDEPFHGELDYSNIIREINACAYDGYIGFKYTPTYGSIVSLEHSLNSYRQAPRIVQGQYC